MMSVIDFHTHVLPGIDDGSSSLEESISMLSAMKKQGIDRAVATPHFYANHDLPERFLEKRAACEETLRLALESRDDLPEISVGAEVYFFEGISDCEYLQKMKIADTNCVMIEMPMKPWSERNLMELVGIKQKQHLTPIIAHVDRYIKPFTAKKLFSRLSELPVLIQVNANFFINRSTRRLALSLLREGKIHLIGSDCHNLESRPPNVRAALDIIGDGLSQTFCYAEKKIFVK